MEPHSCTIFMTQVPVGISGSFLHILWPLHPAAERPHTLKGPCCAHTMLTTLANWSLLLAFVCISAS